MAEGGAGAGAGAAEGNGWPQVDKNGYCQSYKEKGVWANWWGVGKPSFGSLPRLMMGKDDSNIPSQIELDETLPVEKPYWLDPNTTSPVGSAGVRATWLGHASVLAEVDSTVIITDPIFSQRASAISWIGPKRYRPPACSIAELPEKLDAVVISHNHYDHLDHQSVNGIQKRYGDKIHWFVPSGMGDWLQSNADCKKENVHELVWWQEAKIPGGDTTFVLTPANHWCQRGIFDANKVLWGSWAVIGPKHRFWFGGDTAYAEVFSQIGRRYGPFDLSAIPVGAYEPQWFMKWIHVNPKEAVQVHRDLNSLKSFGIHWGTFKLTSEHYLEPRYATLSEVVKQGLERKDFEIVNIGCTVHGSTQE